MNLFEYETPRRADSPLGWAWSFQAARVVQVAVRLRLFTLLDQAPATTEGLAHTLGSNPAMTERLLVALAALELVRHDEGTWRNTLAATLYLVDERPLYQGDVIEWTAEVWNQYHRLEGWVRNGRPHEEEDGFTLAGREERYRAACHALAVAGAAQRLARLVPLAGRQTLLDLGGGMGTYSIALCQRFPALRVTLLDDAAALAQAREVLPHFQATDRLSPHEGDWRTAPLEERAWEAILLTQALAESEAPLLELLLRAYTALRAQGVLVLCGQLLDNDLNGGRGAAFGHLLGHRCTLEQAQALLAEAGFERITLLFRHPDEGDILVAHKPADEVVTEPEDLLAFASPDEEEMFALMDTGEDDEEGSLSLHRRAWEGAARPG